MYNPAFLQRVADVATASIKGFDSATFLKDVFADGWEQLELKQRIRRISTVLHSQLPGKFPADVKQLLNFTRALHKMSGRDDSFLYMFVPDYIEQYGTAHVQESLAAMETVTILSSCEFAIRPFIIEDKVAVLKVMLGWTSHEHASVRRLASEGCRPRLPWAMALPELKKDPSLILPILDKLKNDPSEFVRKSVANNLNDIAKDNQAVLLALTKKWMGSSKNTDWILKHGCRTLLKKADVTALQMFGLSHEPQSKVDNLKLQHNSLKIGEHLHFSFTLTSESTVPAALRVEYAITYAKANDKQSRKVFKITENTYQPGQVARFSRKQSFADMTTRKHYAGAHSIAILINGQEQAGIEFIVTS